MKASAAKVLSMLREAGDNGVSTATFAREFCPRASARICELRHEHGLEIESRCVASNSYLYFLHSEPVGFVGVPPVADESSGVAPAPPASARSLPPDAGLTLFDLPAPGESPDADRYRDSDQRDAA